MLDFPYVANVNGTILLLEAPGVVHGKKWLTLNTEPRNRENPMLPSLAASQRSGEGRSLALFLLQVFPAAC